MTECRIFISSVTKEFGSYRTELARVLRMRDDNDCSVVVKTQEEFQTGSGTLLEKDYEYIQSCHVVICLMGDRYGEEPPPPEATRYAFSFSDTPAGATPRHSYTQWEFLFARRLNKAVYVFLPTDNTPRDEAYRVEPEPETLQHLQASFVGNVIEAEGRDRSYFNSLEELKDMVQAKNFGRDARAHFHSVPLSPNNPYIGLRPFRESERDSFFGRDQLIADSEAIPLLLVLGASGSGKSSVLRAGVIPAWRDQHGGKCRVIAFNPDEDPFTGLFGGLLSAGFTQEEARPAQTPSSTVIRDRFEALRQPGEPWLVFIDQFEEIFTRAPRREDAQARVRQFVAALVDIARHHESNPNPGLRVIFAVRDDFFSNLEGHKELCAITDEHFRRVPRMTERELRAVIQNPAAAHGVSFEPGLIERILADLEDPRGRLPLPWLEYTLEALWERDDISDRVLNLDAYEAIGGVRGALQQKVSAYYESLDPERQRALRRILLRLVEIGEAEIPVSRAARKAELEGGTDAVSGIDAEVLDELLRKEKLLVAHDDETETGNGEGVRPESVIELAHEALISGWGEFKKWIDESRETITMRNRLREDAAEWEQLEKSADPAEARSTKDELWTGSRLERALELNTNGDFDQIGGLNRLERSFLIQSQFEKRRGSRRRISAIAAIAALAFCVVGILIKMEFVAQQNDIRAQASEALRLQDIEFRARGQVKLGIAANALENPAEAANRLLRGYILAAEHHPDIRQSALNLFANPKLPLAVVRHEGPVKIAQFSPNGDRIVTASEDGTAQVWNSSNGKPIGEAMRHDGMVRHAQFSADGNRVVTTSLNGTARIWDADSGEPIGEVLRHDGIVIYAEFDMNGNRVVTASADKTAQIWDANSGEPIGSALRHNGVVFRAQFSFDGELVVTASGDNTAQIWDAASGNGVENFLDFLMPSGV
ncbi:MAG: hypothetical protein ACI8UO_004624 [Verrucomicrobiales bacterium]|jgi:hypothetical protein